MKNTTHLAVIGLCAALTASCASSPATTTATATSAPAQTIADAPKPATRAGMVAAKLAEAEEAFDAGDKAVLAELVAALKMSGVRTLEPAQSDQLAMWQNASGAPSTPYRGRLLGPAYVRGELAPGEIWRSAQTFKSGEASTLSVSHKGSGPIRMMVSDAKARAVCNPSTVTKPPCQFTPMFTQRYNIELTNEGSEDAVYFLVFD